MLRIVRQRVSLLIEAESRIDFGSISAQLSRYNRPTKDDGFFVFSIRERNVRTVLVRIFEQEYVTEKITYHVRVQSTHNIKRLIWYVNMWLKNTRIISEYSQPTTLNDNIEY